MAEFLLEQKWDELENLAGQLKSAENGLEVLNALPAVKDFFAKCSASYLQNLSKEEEYVVKSIVAIGQGERLFSQTLSEKEQDKRFHELMAQLLPVEKFYAELGGIVGYHWHVLSLMRGAKTGAPGSSYHRPQGIDIASNNQEVADAIYSGIERLDELAEIYPVGGAADRLRLHDERTGLPLPAAKLIFCGKTLLEGLIADLQAREYVHYKLFGKQVTTPIAMMTSREKDNHAQILAICEENRWFSRPKEQFRFFCQPSVPAINLSGNWCLQGPLKPLLKPGGHGVIWKLARDEKVFDWLFSLGRKKALVRQINNPIAGCDHGLLAFTGLGCKGDKIFGFASCPRRVKASEGVNVLIKRESQQFSLTNIEYCDFKKFEIVDEPVEEGSAYSKFSSNTNILFADLGAVLEAVSKAPLPGMLVNFKKTSYRTEDGKMHEEEMGRLETTMQNIADHFEAAGESELKAFLTYNDRRKTISTVKREFVLGSSLLETPEGCFLDLMKNARDLLVNLCGFSVPEVNDAAIFFIQGPSFIFQYHPALGPLYGIIAQKLRGGCLKRGSELLLEIAEVDIENLEVEGSLIVHAESIMGHEEDGILNYSEGSGKCVMKNVTVSNQGIDWEASNVFWRGEIARRESFLLIIKGSGEFYAEDVVFKGEIHIEVESGTRMTASMKNGKIEYVVEKITAPTWHWDYQMEPNALHPVLKKKNS